MGGPLTLGVLEMQLARQLRLSPRPPAVLAAGVASAFLLQGLILSGLVRPGLAVTGFAAGAVGLAAIPTLSHLLISRRYRRLSLELPFSALVQFLLVENLDVGEVGWVRQRHRALVLRELARRGLHPELLAHAGAFPSDSAAEGPSAAQVLAALAGLRTAEQRRAFAAVAGRRRQLWWAPAGWELDVVTLASEVARLEDHSAETVAALADHWEGAVADLFATGEAVSGLPLGRTESGSSPRERPLPSTACPSGVGRDGGW